MPNPGPTLGPKLTLHQPADHDLVEHAVGLIRASWLADLGPLAEPRNWLDELSTKDVDSIVAQVSAHWITTFDAVKPRLLDIVAETVSRGMLHLPDDSPSFEHLNALGAKWLDTFGRTMMERWVGQRIRHIASASMEPETQSLVIVNAIEAIPDAFTIVMQPLVRRLLAFGSMLQEIERHEPYVTVHKAREQQRYVVITAQDKKVCKVCEYISELGSFWLKDALDLFDNFMDAVDDDALAAEIVKNEWLSEKDVVGRTRTELKGMGYIIPPFHPRCRCGIAFVQ